MKLGGAVISSWFKMILLLFSTSITTTSTASIGGSLGTSSRSNIDIASSLLAFPSSQLYALWTVRAVSCEGCEL
jgi:hypothetical protein